MLLDDLMPEFDVRDETVEVIRASPADVWADLRQRDLVRDPVSRALFFVRNLFDDAPVSSLRVNDIVGGDGGFELLAEDPGHELVVGAIGKFWQPVIEFHAFEPESFTRTSVPGMGRLAWNIRVEPCPDGSRAHVEVRVQLPDDEARRRFRRYWRLIGPFSGLIRRRTLAAARKDLEARVARDRVH